MHPRITELRTYLDTQTAALRRAWESIAPDRQGLRPSPDRWSPAEVMGLSARDGRCAPGEIRNP